MSASLFVILEFIAIIVIAEVIVLSLVWGVECKESKTQVDATKHGPEIQLDSVFESSAVLEVAEVRDVVLEPVEQPARWNSALEKTRSPFLQKLQGVMALLGGKEAWKEDHALWEALEEVMITSDISPRMSMQLLDELKPVFQSEPTEDALKKELRSAMVRVFDSLPNQDFNHESPKVTVLIGINGSGKTTTTGKLAFLAKKAGKKVIVGAGDTFRAAAVEQLKAWADRLNVECIEPATGANPAAVAFDTIEAGLARNADQIIIDTAGRLHTKESLMEELGKVGRVIRKKLGRDPDEVYLVLDATLGQNALIQAKEFTQIMPVTGVILTKLDGSAKGGAALSVVSELKIPITYVGLGEKAEDLRAFSAQDFVDNIIPL